MAQSGTPVGRGQMTITATDPISSSTPPANPFEGMTWIDTSKNPPVHKVYKNGQWVIVVDAAQLDRNATTERVLATHEQSKIMHDTLLIDVDRALGKSSILGSTLTQQLTQAKATEASRFTALTQAVTTYANSTTSAILSVTTAYNAWRTAYTTLAQRASDAHQAISAHIEGIGIDAKAAAERMKYLSEVLTKGTSHMEGGLIAGNVIAVHDLQQVVRAYLSGDPSRAEFLAAGVDGFGTNQQTSKIMLYHDGYGHIGQMHFDGSTGVLDFREIGSSSPYMTIGSPLTPLSELLAVAEQNFAVHGASLNIEEVAQTDYSPTPSPRNGVYSFDVPEDGYSVKIKTRISISGRMSRSGSASIDYGAALYLDVEGVGVSSGLGSVSRYGTVGYNMQVNEQREIEISLSNLSRGRYSINAKTSLWVSSWSSSYGQVPRLTFKVDPVSVSGVKLKQMTNVQLSNKGLCALFGSRRYFYVSGNPNEPILSARGGVDLPGVLFSASVDGRTVQRTTGSGRSTKRYYPVRRSCGWYGRNAECYDGGANSVGYYAFHHGLGHANYQVQITAVAEDVPVFISVYHKGANGLWIYVKDHRGNPTQASFDITLVGSNHRDTLD